MRRQFFSLAAAVFVTLGAACPAAADFIFWYNGDLRTDGGGTVNEETTNLGSLNIFEDFRVTDPGGWTIGRVWSNNAMQVTGITQASWSIRSGMAVGNGGTVIAGGTSAATQTLTGRINPSLGFPEYTIEVTGLNVSLAPGTYWLSVSPLVGNDAGGVLKSYVSATVGANAVGTPPGNNGNSLFFAPALGYNYADAFGFDYSLGVAGAVAAPVPEPSAIALSAVGMAGLAGFAWRRRKRQDGRGGTSTAYAK
jgi:PEP-CTERM motif